MVKLRWNCSHQNWLNKTKNPKTPLQTFYNSDYISYFPYHSDKILGRTQLKGKKIYLGEYFIKFDPQSLGSMCSGRLSWWPGHTVEAGFPVLVGQRQSATGRVLRLSSARTRSQASPLAAPSHVLNFPPPHTTVPHSSVRNMTLRVQSYLSHNMRKAQ